MVKTHRLEQVNELLRQKISEIILKEVELPTDCFATITKAKAAPDMKEAIILVSVLPYNQGEMVIKIFKKNRYKIQAFLGAYLSSKHTPKLDFRLDSQEEKASKIERLLDEI